MALRKLMKSSGIAALAASLAFVAMPSAASADPGDHGHGNSENRGGDRGGNENRGSGEHRGGGWQQRQQAAPQAQAAPQQQREVRSDRGNTPGAGWGSQRPEAGQRYGRDWNNGGVVNRPAPAYRNEGAAHSVQQPPMAQYPRYSDQNRNGRDANRDVQRQRQQGWDGQRWQGQNWDHNRDGRRDVNRGGDWNRDRTANWSRDWRRDNRYNYNSWRDTHRDVFRLGRYYAPYRSYSYRRLSIGFYLDNLFFGSNYWINDPWQYRLPPAYGPYRWVRYYDDALLVNIYDGEVVDVIYDFFW